MDFKKIIKETVHKALLREYFDAKPQRLPFGDSFYEDNHIYDYVNWLKQAGKIGNLPKPKITWDEGLRKGCIEYVKKYGAPDSGYNSDELEDSKIIYKIYKQVRERLNPVVSFDNSGNLYVERAITISKKTNYQQLIDDYQSNPGGCWALKKGKAKAYFGDRSKRATNIVLKGYMFLDDIFWGELIRKTVGEHSDEYEVRSTINGKVEITELDIDNETLPLDKPVIIQSAYFGNNQRFNGEIAQLGYGRITNDYKYIDRQGNLIKDLSDSEISDLIKTNFAKRDNPFRGKFKDGFMCFELFGKYNYIDKQGNLLINQPWSKWFKWAKDFNDGVGIILHNNKYYLINTEGGLITNKGFKDVLGTKEGITLVQIGWGYNFVNFNGDLLSNEGFDSANLFSNGFAKVEIDGKYNFINTRGRFLRKGDLDQWFDAATNFKNGYAKVKINGEIFTIDSYGFLS